MTAHPHPQGHNPSSQSGRNCETQMIKRWPRTLTRSDAVLACIEAWRIAANIAKLPEMLQNSNKAALHADPSWCKQTTLWPNLTSQNHHFGIFQARWRGRL